MSKSQVHHIRCPRSHGLQATHAIDRHTDAASTWLYVVPVHIHAIHTLLLRIEVCECGYQNLEMTAMISSVPSIPATTPARNPPIMVAAEASSLAAVSEINTSMQVILVASFS